jgi:hypothetical protein
VTEVNGTRLRADIGRFHGVSEGMRVALVRGASAEGETPGPAETVLARGSAAAVGDLSSEFTFDSPPAGIGSAQDLWVKEVAE